MEFSAYNQSFEDLKKRCFDLINNQNDSIDRLEVLKTIIGLIDLTTLGGDDTNNKVADLCNKAIGLQDVENGISNVAAVCVYPVFADLVRTKLINSDVKTACVAGAFPSGQSPLNIRVEEVKYAVKNGADEIDMVISRGKLLEGDFEYIVDEITAIKEACGNAHLKVILETGELLTTQNIRKASELAIIAGADFIKTSTGKITPAATMEATLIMLDTIKEYYQATGKMIGIKPAGGISEPTDAISYYLLVKSVLGHSWLNSKYFRIGASRLTDKLYNEIKNN